jgi:hypothetical protein
MPDYAHNHTTILTGFVQDFEKQERNQEMRRFAVQSITVQMAQMTTKNNTPKIKKMTK